MAVLALLISSFLVAAPPPAGPREEVLRTARHPGLRWPDLADVAPELRELYAAEADGLFWYAGETPEPALAGALDALARAEERAATTRPCIWWSASTATTRGPGSGRGSSSTGAGPPSSTASRPARDCPESWRRLHSRRCTCSRSSP